MQRTPFDIPDQMRDAADKSVEQARRAFDQFIDATQKAVAKAEGSVKSMREGAADVNRQALAFVEENIAASFDLAQKLVRAHTIEEVAAVQQEFLQRQMAAAAEQGKAIGTMMGRAAKKREEPARIA
jgi:phasin